MSNKKIVVQLDSSELDTVIVALRLWQAAANQDYPAKGVHIESEQYESLVDMSCEHGEALTKTEIDGLCERINFAPEAECDCDDRSWHGEEHDSACPLTGKR